MNQSLAAKIGWIFAIVVAIASCIFMQIRLAPLPDLNVELGPSLLVRGTKVFQSEEADSAAATIQTGDKVLSLGGQRVEDLRDARVAAIGVQKMISRQKEGLESGRPLSEVSIKTKDGLEIEGLDALATPKIVPLSYQLLRPRHVFLVSLKDSGGVTKDIYNLMRPEDTLLEIDGRRLPNPVGIEAARSVVNSRPDAVLTIERHDALFSGFLYTSMSLMQYSHFAAFFLVLLVFLLLFFIGRRTDNLAAASFTALETVLFVWISLLSYRYMWVLADPMVRGGVIVSLVFFRPVSAVAVAVSQYRSPLRYRTKTGSLWISIIASAIACAALLVVNGSDNPESWELAPQVAGLVLLIFLVYEVIAGYTSRARSPIVDRSGYVAGIIGLTCLGAIFAYFTDPNAFLQGRWCLFAMILVGLIWSADLVYVLTANNSDQMTVVETQTGRANLILDYLESLDVLSYSTAFGLVVWRATGSVILRREQDVLVVESTTKALHDAIAILIQEQAIIPAPGVSDPHEDPMAGIASTMGLSLAFTMAPPDRAIIVDNAELVAVGFDTNSDPAESLPLPMDVLQSVQDLMTPEVWVSSFLEALAFGKFVADEAPVEVDTSEVEILRENLEKDKKTIQELTREKKTIESLRDLFRAQLNELSPNEYEFEPELLKSFDFLLASKGPIIVAGDVFSGKRLTASAASMRDTMFDGKRHFIIDAAHVEFDALLEEAFLNYVKNSTLIIENAQILSPQQLRRLIQVSNDHHRLYLLFVDTTLGEESVLLPYSAMLPDVFEPLMARELLLPELWRRPRFLQSAINVFLLDANDLLKKDVSGFSDSALAYLQQLPWRGGLMEVKLVVFYCVAHTKEPIMDNELIMRFWSEL